MDYAAREVIKVKKKTYANSYLEAWGQGWDMAWETAMKSQRAAVEGLIFSQLHQRCGDLSEKDRERVRQLSLPRRYDLGVALLNFKNINSLRRWLRKHEPQDHYSPFRHVRSFADL